MELEGFSVHESILGQGPPLLFLHGWGVGHEVYMPLLTALSARFTVYAPDLPGFGGTAEPQTPWILEDYVSFVRAYLIAHDIQNPVMIGHSNGGRVLLSLLGRYDAPAAAKLVLLAPACLKAKHSVQYYIKVYGYKLAKLVLTPFPKAKKRYQAGKGSADYRAASPCMKETMKHLLSSDLRSALSLVQPSTLMIWGKEDTAAPYTNAKILEKEMRDAGLVSLEGGHWAFAEHLGQCLRVLDVFL